MLEEYQKEAREVIIELEDKRLEGLLHVPEGSSGLVIFAHGSGSSRFSTRNQYVASCLCGAGLATLLFDLLTAEEDEIDVITREYRFDIPMLAERLEEVTGWVLRQEELKGMKTGYFGSSTGAAAALIAASHRQEDIDAVVSRGGRPDLAKGALREVKAPTLLVVGGLDGEVILLNKEAQSQMTNENEIRIIEGATHLFEEPGKLEEVARVVAEWLTIKLL